MRRVAFDFNFASTVFPVFFVYSGKKVRVNKTGDNGNAVDFNFAFTFFPIFFPCIR